MRKFLVPALLTGFIIVVSANYEKKYSISDFKRLSWEIFPSEGKDNQQLSGKVWTINNTLPEPILLIAPYKEESFGLEATFHFESGALSRAGIFFNLQDDISESGKATLMAVEVTPNGQAFYSLVQYGNWREISRASFKMSERKPRDVTLKLTKIEKHIEVRLNAETMKLADENPLGVGTFGFIFSPMTKVKLSDFKFTRYRKEFVPFQGIDVEATFGKKKEG